mmetsp:Transcript_21787/g.72054  ORF Transcript_21787/g.72054 Transcript_21787/m.72054 type:complete len:97 (-) Transcript_21787:464-754(-)
MTGRREKRNYPLGFLQLEVQLKLQLEEERRGQVLDLKMRAGPLPPLSSLPPSGSRCRLSQLKEELACSETEENACLCCGGRDRGCGAEEKEVGERI